MTCGVMRGGAVWTLIGIAKIVSAVRFSLLLAFCSHSVHMYIAPLLLLAKAPLPLNPQLFFRV